MNLKSSPPSNQTNTFLSLICASQQKQNRGKQKVNLFDMVEERLLFVRNSFIRLSQPLYSDTMVPLYRKLKGLLPIFPLGRMAPSRAREKERERKRLDPPFLRRQSLSLKPWKQQRRRRRERAEGAKKTFGSLLLTQGPPSALDTSPAGRESEKEVGREEEGPFVTIICQSPFRVFQR